VVNLEINQPRALGRRVINHIGDAGVAVRPSTAKFFGPELMCAPKLFRRGAEHLSGQGSAVQMFPQIFAR
jgi:hypothetical protein